MLTPSTLTLAQTQVGTVAVDTSLLSGANQVLTLMVDPIPGPPFAVWPVDISPKAPNWYKAYFAPPAIKAGDSSVLTIDTCKMPVGTYTINVTAVGDVVTHTAQLTLVVTPSDFSI